MLFQSSARPGVDLQRDHVTDTDRRHFASPACSSEGPYSGYVFVNLSTGLNYTYEYALGAEPKAYDSTGVLSFFVDQTGVIWQKDQPGGFAGTTVPVDPEQNGWVVAGQ